MAVGAGPRLPLELILHIIKQLPEASVVAYNPRTDPIGRCIRSWTLVCRETYPLASQLLHRHCLYIDSEERLRRLLVSLSGEHVSTRHPPCLPEIDRIACIESLYLQPFGRSMDNQPVAQWIFELFAAMRSTLKRLVIDMPFHSLAPGNDHLDVLPKLQTAFQELEVLEELTSMNDEALPTGSFYGRGNVHHDGPLWSGLKGIRRLALHINHDFLWLGWVFLSQLTNLEILVLADSSGDQRTDGWQHLLWRCTQPRLTIVNWFMAGSARPSLVKDSTEAAEKARIFSGASENVDFVFVSGPADCVCDHHGPSYILASMLTKVDALSDKFWDPRLQKIALDPRFQERVSLDPPNSTGFLYDCCSNQFVEVHG